MIFNNNQEHQIIPHTLRIIKVKVKSLCETFLSRVPNHYKQRGRLQKKFRFFAVMIRL